MSERTQRPPHLLVTGATGPIGAVLVPQLLADWSRVTVLGRDASRSAALQELLRQRRIEFAAWDLEQPEPSAELARALDAVTHLIHGAALSDDVPALSADAIRMVQVNLHGAIRLLRYLPGLVSVCYLSSVAVYGPPQVCPCPESHPTQPRRLYGMTKLALEQLLGLHARRTGVALTVLRVSSVYGFPDPALASTRAIPTFLRRCAAGEPLRILHDGALRRDYVHVQDVVDAVRAAARGHAAGTYNIASGEGHSLLDLARLAGEAVGRTPEIRLDPAQDADPDFSTDIAYDITRAREALGFRPSRRMAEAMRSLAAAHEQCRAAALAGQAAPSGGR